MAFSFVVALRNARADSITTQLGTGAKLKIYTSAYGTLLATWSWTGNVWVAAASGIITMNAPTTNPVTPAANGTAAIAKLTTSADADKIIDLTVGTSGTDVVLNNTSIATTAPITLNSVTITEAA